MDTLKQNIFKEIKSYQILNKKMGVNMTETKQNNAELKKILEKITQQTKIIEEHALRLAQKSKILDACKEISKETTKLTAQL